MHTIWRRSCNRHSTEPLAFFHKDSANENMPMVSVKWDEGRHCLLSRGNPVSSSRETDKKALPMRRCHQQAIRCQGLRFEIDRKKIH